METIILWRGLVDGQWESEEDVVVSKKHPAIYFPLHPADSLAGCLLHL